MTNTTTRTLEQIAQELEEAKVAERKLAEEADREKKEAYRELHELDQERVRLDERREDASDKGHVANAEWHDHNRAKGAARRELAALEARGPDFDLLKRSSLRPRL